MKAFLKKLLRILPHVPMIFSVIFIVFMILDEYNPTMKFVSNDISTVLLWILCVTSIASSVRAIAKDRKLTANKRTPYPAMLFAGFLFAQRKLNYLQPKLIVSLKLVIKNDKTIFWRNNERTMI